MGFWSRFRPGSAEHADFDYLIEDLTVRELSPPVDQPPTPPPPAGVASAENAQITDFEVVHRLPTDLDRETAEPEPPLVESDGPDPGVDSPPGEDLDDGDRGRDEERLDQETGDVPCSEPEPGFEEARRFAQAGHEANTSADGIHIPVDPPADLDPYDRRWNDGDVRPEQPQPERTDPRRGDDAAVPAAHVAEVSPPTSPASQFDDILRELFDESEVPSAGVDGQRGHDLD